MSSLRARLAAGLAMLAALAVLIPGAGLLMRQRAADEDRESARRAEMVADLQRIAESWRSALEQALGADDGGPTSPQATAPGEAAAVRPVDLEWSLAGDGTILACAHWPARVGGQATAALQGLGSEPQVRVVVIGERDVPALLLAGEGRPGPPASRPASARRIVGLDLSRAVAALPELAATRWLLLPPGTDSAGAGDADLIAAAQPLDDAGGWRLAAVGRPSGAAPSPMASLGPLLLAALAAALLAAMAGAWWGGRLLRPLQQLDEMADALAGGRLDFELDSDRHDEIGRLTTSFNRMISALRRQRLELAESERLAAWRDAARRMAHEVKNPLLPIRMSVENLARARQRTPEQFDAMLAEESRTILEEVDALTRLVDSFSRFARLPEPQLRQADPAAPLRHVARLHRDAAGDIELTLEAPEGLPAARLDPDLMAQVLTNLLANALAVAPRPGGRVTAACRVDGPTLVYEVRDNGPGIPEKIRRHLFEPQVSARPGGSGLGLAVARQIVTAHGGRIAFKSVPGATCFTVRLPLHGAGSPA